MIPYGRQSIVKEDVKAVVDVLTSDWLTTGPAVGRFEEKFAETVGAKYAVAVSSGTAALHCAMHAARIGPGDQVIVPAITFVASANCVVYTGATPVFADVDPETLLIDMHDVEKKVGPHTRMIIAVDYAGQPCDYDALKDLSTDKKLNLVADACHSVGGSLRGRPVGSLADMSVFSFHPVKHITTGEGGVVTTDNREWADAIRRFRNHGISTDHHQRSADGSWFYEMVDLGFNYRITDFQCGLGESQLKRLPDFLQRRKEIAAIYDRELRGLDGIKPLKLMDSRQHAYHLYVVKLLRNLNRDRAFDYLRSKGIGVNVHYIPVYLHPFYKEKFGFQRGLCPVAEQVYKQVLSLPLFPDMTKDQVERVIDVLYGIALKAGRVETEK